jgi:hypothetical protein
MEKDNERKIHQRRKEIDRQHHSAIKNPRSKLRGIKTLRHTGKGRCPQPNHWIPAFAGMTSFAAIFGELNP